MIPFLFNSRQEAENAGTSLNVPALSKEDFSHNHPLNLAISCDCVDAETPEYQGRLTSNLSASARVADACCVERVVTDGILTDSVVAQPQPVLDVVVLEAGVVPDDAADALVGAYWLAASLPLSCAVEQALCQNLSR